MLSQIFTQDAFKILTLFSLSPGSRFRRRDIKEKTRLHNVPLDKALMRLLSSDILMREGNYYSVNFENPFSKKIIDILSSQYHRMKDLPLSVYFLLADIVYSLSAVKGLEVYLFGSYSKLIFRDDSDVDIAIVSEEKLKKGELNVSRLEKTYGKVIEIHAFEKREFYRNKRDPLIKNILKDGIRLV